MTTENAFQFELQDLMDSIKSEQGYQQGRHSRVLAKYSDFRVVLMVMTAGARIKEHTATGRISVQAIAGHLQMHVGERLLDLPAGRLAVLDRGVPHDVVALEDSAFLLTIGAAEP